MSKITDTYWYSCLAGLIGIVECEDEITKEIKYYIGIAYGANKEADARYIQQNGARLYPKILFKQSEKYRQALKNIIDGNIGKCCCTEEYAQKILEEVDNG